MRKVALLSTILYLAFVSAANATVYFVDKATGSDGNAGTSTGSPWATIKKAADTMVAGDTVNVRTGVYFETATTTQEGTVGNPITYNAGWAGDPPGRTVLDGLRDRLTGFDLTNKPNYTTINGFEIRNFKGNGIDASRFPSAIGDILTNNYIHHIGIKRVLGQFDHGNGIYSPYAIDWNVTGNTFEETWYNGINTDGTNMNFTGNTLLYGHRVAIGISATGTIMVANNTVIGWQEDRDGVHADGMQFISFPDRLGVHSTLTITGNYVRDNVQGVEVQPFSPTPVLGNKPGGATVIAGNKFFNTQYLVGGDNTGLGGNGNCTLVDHGYNDIVSVNFHHNIASNCNRGSGGFDDEDRFDSFGVHHHISDLKIRNNIFYNSLNENKWNDTNLVQAYTSNNNVYKQQYRDWYLPGFRNLTQYHSVFPDQEVNSIGFPF